MAWATQGSVLVAALVLGGVLALASCWLLAAHLARRGFPLPDPARRIGHLDGLRGWLALSVLLGHYVQWTRVLALGAEWGTGPDPAKALGQVPVAIFFMITAILFYPVATGGLAATRWWRFAVLRLHRVCPLAFLSIGIATALLWARSGFTTDGAMWRQTIVHLVAWLGFAGQPPLFGFADSALVNAGVFWTLTSEWLFYLAVLPAVAAARSLTWAWMPRWTTPLYLAPVALVLRLVWPGQADLMLPFMLGMTIAELRHHPRLVALLRCRSAVIASIALMLVALAVLPPPIRDRTAPFYAPFLACVACAHRPGWLSHPASAVLGEVSFGIYVLHGIVLWLGTGLFARTIAHQPALAALVLLPILAVIAFGVAAVASRWVEQPMIAAGHRRVRSLWREAAARTPGLA